jgi:uncharacterized protein YkwD
MFERISTFTLVFLTLITSVFTQNKIKELYEAQKYLKCINLCNKNIQEQSDIQMSLLYKSMALTAVQNDSTLLSVDSAPLIEALECIRLMELHKSKNPSDKFYPENKIKIKNTITSISNWADGFFIEHKQKEYLEIYDKLMEIYPESTLYIFKTAKAYNFNKQEFIKRYSEMDEDKFYESLLEIAENSGKYFPKNAKQELSDALLILYNNNSSDLECISIILVNLRKRFGTDPVVKEQINKYCETYRQIDMLLLVNAKRASGIVCGSDKMIPQPPLYLSNCLTHTAQKYSEVMNNENHFSHTSPDGKSPWTRAAEEGCSADGENIAWGSSTVSDALNLWLESPGHCSNIMGYHTYMGIGESGGYWVQMFE